MDAAKKLFASLPSRPQNTEGAITLPHTFISKDKIEMKKNQIVSHDDEALTSDQRSCNLSLIFIKIFVFIPIFKANISSNQLASAQPSKVSTSISKMQFIVPIAFTAATAALFASVLTLAS